MKKPLLVVLIVGVVLIFLFYWYELRPSNIKKSCNSASIEEAKDQSGSNDKYHFGNYENYYQVCLREHGL